MDTKIKKLFRNSLLEFPTRWSTPPPPAAAASSFDRADKPRQSFDGPPRINTKTSQQHRTWRKPLPKDAPKIKITAKPDYKQMDRNVSLALGALSACDFKDLPAQLKAELVRQQKEQNTKPVSNLKTLGTASSLYPKPTNKHTPKPKKMPQFPVRQTSLSYQNNPQVTACLLDVDKNINHQMSRRSMESNLSDNTSGEESWGPPTPRQSVSPITQSALPKSMPPEPPKHNFELPQIVTTNAENSLLNSLMSDITLAQPAEIPKIKEQNVSNINRPAEKQVQLRPKVASIKRNTSVRRRPSARRHVSLRRHVNDILANAFNEADDEWENESDDEDASNDHLQVWTRRSLQLDNRSFPLLTTV
ncbi:hypothetical protein BGW37DRAFT_475127, partial [Umbelopsis sp. PMI_123]